MAIAAKRRKGLSPRLMLGSLAKFDGHAAIRMLHMLKDEEAKKLKSYGVVLLAAQQNERTE